MKQKTRINAHIFKEDSETIKENDFTLSFVVNQGIISILDRKKNRVYEEENKRAIEKLQRQFQMLLNKVSELELSVRRIDTYAADKTL